MKTLILIILSFSSFASIEQMVSPEQFPQFKEVLHKFNLLPAQINSTEELEGHIFHQAAPDLQDIIEVLNRDLLGTYNSKAISILGRCSTDECLKEDARGAWIFKDEKDVGHCYPGTNCEYYRCMEEQYRCLDVGVEYFAKLAKPTCEAYVSNIAKRKFSAKGNEWIYNVMVCLQKGLFEECSLRGNCPESESNEKTCQHITEFTLKFHPGCYIDSGVGVCKLPFKDQINIWRTVGPYLTDRERIEAYKVVRYCLFKTPIE